MLLLRCSVFVKMTNLQSGLLSTVICEAVGGALFAEIKL